MFFLLRMAFWFSLVLLALPLDTRISEDGRPAVNPLQAMTAATEAVSDIAGLCERKPHVCETGRSAAQTVAARAGEASRIALDLLDDSDQAPDSALVAGTVPAEPLAVSEPD
ncbi:MAG TPA: DUF5330 domain-containing protein [Mesorhizobium sp.]|jgi:hypothetical protein|nr:DUF5330 domain-containing protein [Mesorhizobium sp.]